MYIRFPYALVLPKKLCTSVIFILLINTVWAQYSWNWQDPIDLNHVDFGDNKLLLYNAIGIGLTFKLSDLSPLEKKIYKNTFFSSYVDVIYEYSLPPKSDVFIGRFRGGKFFRKHLAAGGDISIYKVSDSDISTYGMGFQLFFSWYIINKEKWRLYYDNGVGPNIFAEPFPYGGTRFNFITHYGIFMAHDIPGLAWITLGIKNIHISNAGIKGDTRNPALDGIGISFGYQFH